MENQGMFFPKVPPINRIQDTEKQMPGIPVAAKPSDLRARDGNGCY